MKVALCQVAPAFGDIPANRRLAVEQVAAAADAGADLVVLPELVASGYVFASREEATTLAETVDGPTVEALVAVAAEHRVAVVAGVAELTEDGTLFNTALLVDGSGLRAAYRKAHLWGREPEMFAAGDGSPPVVDIGAARVGLLVCYDLEFPEWVRRVALAGADLVCAPVNWPSGPRPAGERPIEVVNVQAAAAVNGIFIAACDRAGEERGVPWVGGSVLAGPDGYPLALADPHEEAQRLLVEIDPTRARDKRTSTHNDRFTDRRPALYGVPETPRPRFPVG